MAIYATGTGLTPLIVFRNHAPRTGELIYCPATDPGFGAEDDVYDFVEQAGDTYLQDYLNQQGSYILSPEPAPVLPPQPDLAGFKNAMVMDTTIPATAKISVFTFASVLTDLVSAVQSGADPIQVLQGVWAEIKAADTNLSGYCLDGKTPITTQIETYSTQFNIGLV